MAVSFITCLSSRSQFNAFLRFSRGCAVIHRSSVTNWWPRVRFYSGESEGNVCKEQDPRIAPLMRIGFSREESTEYLRKSKYLEKAGLMSLSTMEERIAFFKERHYEVSDIKEIFMRKRLFQYSLKHISASERFLHEELSCNSEEVRKMVTSHPYILHAKRERLSQCLKVVPTLLGMSDDDFRNIIIIKDDPRLLLANPDTIERIVELGKEAQVKMKTILTWVSYLKFHSRFNAEEGKRTIQLLRSFGFEDDDVRVVFERIPFIISLREETAKKNLEYLQTVFELSSMELKGLVVNEPSVIVLDSGELAHKIEYLMKEVELKKEEIIKHCYVLKFNRKRIKARYEFARMCGLTAKSPPYVIVKYSDKNFSKLCGRTTEEYRAYFHSK